MRRDNKMADGKQGKGGLALLVVLYAGAFMGGFNENLANMALVPIMGDYGISSVTAQWLVTGYMIVATVIVMTMAFLYRRIPLRILFYAAVAFTFAGSVLGLFAGSFAILLVARLVQAIGSGIFIPLMIISPPIQTRRARATHGTILSSELNRLTSVCMQSHPSMGMANWKTA